MRGLFLLFLVVSVLFVAVFVGENHAVPVLSIPDDKNFLWGQKPEDAQDTIKILKDALDLEAQLLDLSHESIQIDRPVIGDIALTKEQAQYVYDHLQEKLSAKANRRRRYAINSEEFPFVLWKIDKGIAYNIQKNIFSAREENNIRTAFKIWEENTCIRFTEYPEIRKFFESGGEKILQVRGDSPGCWSFVGNVNDQPIQVLNLQVGACTELTGVTTHEIGHALGLYHLEDDPRRDDNLIFIKENIIPEFAFFLDPLSGKFVNGFGVPWDPTSMMQFRVDVLSINGKLTVIPKNPDFRFAKGMVPELPSFFDYTLINRAYKCYDYSNILKTQSIQCRYQSPFTQTLRSSSTSDTNVKYQQFCNTNELVKSVETTDAFCCNNGYKNPGKAFSCNECFCPDGLTGNCDRPIPGTGNSCHPRSGLYKVGELPQCITSPYYEKGLDYNIGDSCAWILFAPEDYFINVWFDLTDGFGVYHFDDSMGICHHYIEVKLDGNFTNPGKRYCGYDKFLLNQDEPATSTASEVLIYFNALTAQLRDKTPGKFRGFKLCYQLSKVKGQPCKEVDLNTGKCKKNLR